MAAILKVKPLIFAPPVLIEAGDKQSMPILVSSRTFNFIQNKIFFLSWSILKAHIQLFFFCPFLYYTDCDVTTFSDIRIQFPFQILNAFVWKRDIFPVKWNVLKSRNWNSIRIFTQKMIWCENKIYIYSVPQE